MSLKHSYTLIAPFYDAGIARFTQAARQASLAHLPVQPGRVLLAGIGTGPQKSLIHKLDALTENRAEGIPAWLLSHPKTPERIAAIEANEARWTGGMLTARSLEPLSHARLAERAMLGISGIFPSPG